MEMEDDRTPEERKTHRYLVIGTDSFLSGWGGAEGGASYAVWACREEHERDVLEWVQRRSDMKRVRTTFGDYRPKGKGHCHIYVVRDGHPSIASYEQMQRLIREEATR